MANLGEANIGGRMVPAWLLNGNANGLDISESSEYPGCFYRKLSDGSVEWINPPMYLGVEYRTTERYQGKPVYAVCVDVGSAPQGLQTSSLVGFSQYTGIEKVIRLNARNGNSSLPRAIGGTNSIVWCPEGFNAYASDNDKRLLINVGSTGTTNTSVVFDNIQVTVFYTKIAD